MGRILWVGVTALVVAVAAAILVTGGLPLVGHVIRVAGLLVVLLAPGVLALGCRLDPKVWAIVKPVLLWLRSFGKPIVQWWSLDNVQLLASTAFPIAGAIAALAAVNFFYFAPVIPKPTVSLESYVDTSTIPTATILSKVGSVVLSISPGLTQEALRTKSSKYDGGDALAKDCATDRQDVQLIAPDACQSSNSIPNVGYPRYLHALFTSQHPTGAPGAVAAPHLTTFQLPPAAELLARFATPVDVVTVINNGHVEATNVRVILPQGVVAVDATLDNVSFDLRAGETKILLYREVQSPANAGNSPPVEGFDVSNSTPDSVISQELAWRLLLGAAAFLLVLIASDMYRTRTYSGRRHAEPSQPPAQTRS